jgi:general stress protein 26
MTATQALTDDQRSLLEDAVEIAHSTVWCVMTTVDARGRPRNRLVHPVWVFANGALTGWLTTRVTPIKVRHLAGNPNVSLAYIASNTDAAFFDCTAQWVEGDAGKQECWNAFLEAPEPVRYDPATIWPAGAGDPNFAVLRFAPYRVQALRAADVAKGYKAAPVGL